jgi:tetratricopeptide (TPR) repeat protein
VTERRDVSQKGVVRLSDTLNGELKEKGDSVAPETGDSSGDKSVAIASAPDKESKPKSEKRPETVKSYDSWMKEGNHHYRIGSTDDLKKAVLAFQAASKRTSSVEPLSKLGACHSKLGNHEASFRNFKEAIGTNPNYRAAQIGLARALKRAGRMKKARAAYDTYLTRFPDGNHRQEALKALASLKK